MLVFILFTSCLHSDCSRDAKLRRLEGTSMVRATDNMGWRGVDVATLGSRVDHGQ